MNCGQQFWGCTLNNKAAEYCALSVGLICCFSHVTTHTCCNPCWQTKFLPHLLMCRSLKTESWCFDTGSVCFFFYLGAHVSMLPKHNHCINSRLPYVTESFRDTFSPWNFDKRFPFAGISDDELLARITKKECDSSLIVLLQQNKFCQS